MKRFPDRLGTVSVAILAILGTAVFLRYSFGAVTASLDGLAMDTVIRITASGRTNRGALEKTLSKALRLIEELGEKFSMYDERSPVSSINTNAGVRAVFVDADLFSVLESAVGLAKATEGAFDPTIGPLTSLWRIRRREDDEKPLNALPPTEEIASALACVGFQELEAKSPDRVFLRKRGAKIDLGGVAKGYASMKVEQLLRGEGVTSALVDLGGNIVLLGSAPDGRPWRVGIQHPLKARGSPLCAIVSSDTSVITAGTYERFETRNGRTFTHIFDPETGYPVEGDLLSVTVITQDPVTGDALSTAFMVMGIDRSLSYLEKRRDIEAVFVSKTRDAAIDVLATPGLKRFLSSTDEGIEIKFAERK